MLSFVTDVLVMVPLHSNITLTKIGDNRSYIIGKKGGRTNIRARKV